MNFILIGIPYWSYLNLVLLYSELRSPGAFHLRISKVLYKYCVNEYGHRTSKVEGSIANKCSDITVQITGGMLIIFIFFKKVRKARYRGVVTCPGYCSESVAVLGIKSRFPDSQLCVLASRLSLPSSETPLVVP